MVSLLNPHPLQITKKRTSSSIKKRKNLLREPASKTMNSLRAVMIKISMLTKRKKFQMMKTSKEILSNNNKLPKRHLNLKSRSRKHKLRNSSRDNTKSRTTILLELESLELRLLRLSMNMQRNADLAALSKQFLRALIENVIKWLLSPYKIRHA